MATPKRPTNLTKRKLDAAMRVTSLVESRASVAWYIPECAQSKILHSKSNRSCTTYGAISIDQLRQMVDLIDSKGLGWSAAALRVGGKDLKLRIGNMCHERGRGTVEDVVRDHLAHHEDMRDRLARRHDEHSEFQEKVKAKVDALRRSKGR